MEIRGKRESERERKRERAKRGNTVMKEERKYVVIPYCRLMSERLRRVYKRHRISMYSKLGYTQRQALVAPSDPLQPDEKCGAKTDRAVTSSMSKMGVSH